jgi:hypothetical protein
MGSMNASRKLALYGMLLVAMVAGGAAVGAAVGPEPSEPDSSECATASDLPSGLASTLDGYTLSIWTRQLPADEPGELRFVVIAPDGRPLLDYDVVHEKELHLVVVGRNLVDYAHVHPEQSEDGTWSVMLPALASGSYRVFADFTPGDDDRLTLAGDVTVLGEVAASDVPAPSDVAIVDGYDVRFGGELTAGTESELTVTIERDSDPVTDVEPYLGALGHLVAVRDGDLGYLHVHPLEEADAPGGPSVTFAVEFPTSGMYRLFFEFDHDGAVHAAQVTLAAAPAEGCEPTGTGGDGDPDHGHEG